MNKSPIFNIEIFLKNVLMYLQSIEIDLKLINHDDPKISVLVQSLFIKHSNQFIKNNNNKLNAINEIKTFVLLTKEQQKDLSQMFINPSITEITDKHNNIEFILNKMNRFALNHLAIDYVQFLEFKTVWDNLNNETKNTIQDPFKDQKTKDLFEYIVQNWKNKATSKWGYIWIYLVQMENGKMTFKIDYEAYLIEMGLLTKGKPNYDNCNSQKRYDQLEVLKEQFDRLGS
jgi:hypothetical protein